MPSSPSCRPERRQQATTTRSIVGVAVATLVFAVSACGSSDDSAVPSADDASEAATVVETAATEPVEATAPSDAVGDAGTATLTIETDTGESWTLEQTKCLYQPDNQGTFVELWGAEALSPSGVDFGVIASTPADPSSGEEITVFGTLVDDASEILYVVIEGEAVSDGTTLTMTLGMHSSALRAVGDPIDLTATVTCQL